MNDKSTYIAETDKKAFEELEKSFWAGMMWGLPKVEKTEEEKYLDSLKWAYVTINTEDENRTMLHVSNIDKKAYKMNGYETVKPLEEIKYHKFNRWCSSFDL